MGAPYLHITVLLAFLINTLGIVPLAKADEFFLPAPGAMVNLSPAYNPPLLKGLKVHPDNPFRFDFILDQGDSALPTRGHVPLSRDVSPRSSSRTLAVARTLPTKSAAESESTPGKSPNDLKQEANKLIKYFLASLTIPEKDLWVNLSPYEKNRIIPDAFGRTEMGRDLLAEDYMLKQITSSLIYPEGETGKKFWKKVYAEAAKRFGTTNIPVNTFNKVWIVPEKAVVYENAKAGTAYVVESKLKVMLEEDYLSQAKHGDIGVLQNGDCPVNIVSQGTVPILRGSNIHMLSSQMIREIVIPELTKEVNTGANFAKLRQVYNSLILATWYKKKIKDSILTAVYANKNKIQGITITTPGVVEVIYKRYLQAFKKGVYNYIKEETDPVTQQPIPRKYFSGGLTLKMDQAMRTTADAAMVDQDNSSGRYVEIDSMGEPTGQNMNHKIFSKKPADDLSAALTTLHAATRLEGDEAMLGKRSLLAAVLAGSLAGFTLPSAAHAEIITVNGAGNVHLLINTQHPNPLLRERLMNLQENQLGVYQTDVVKDEIRRYQDEVARPVMLSLEKFDRAFGEKSYVIALEDDPEGLEKDIKYITGLSTHKSEIRAKLNVSEDYLNGIILYLFDPVLYMKYWQGALAHAQIIAAEDATLFRQSSVIFKGIEQSKAEIRTLEASTSFPGLKKKEPEKKDLSIADIEKALSDWDEEFKNRQKSRVLFTEGQMSQAARTVNQAFNEGIRKLLRQYNAFIINMNDRDEKSHEKVSAYPKETVKLFVMGGNHGPNLTRLFAMDKAMMPQSNPAMNSFEDAFDQMFKTPIQIGGAELKKYLKGDALQNVLSSGGKFYVRRLDPQADKVYLLQWQEDAAANPAWQQEWEAQRKAKGGLTENLPRFKYLDSQSFGLFSDINGKTHLEGFIGIGQRSNPVHAGGMVFSYPVHVDQMEVYFRHVGRQGQIKGIAELLFDLLIKLCADPQNHMDQGITFYPISDGSRAFGEGRKLARDAYGNFVVPKDEMKSYAEQNLGEVFNHRDAAMNPSQTKGPMLINGHKVELITFVTALDRLRVKTDTRHQDIWEITDMPDVDGLRPLVQLPFEVAGDFIDGSRWLLISGTNEKVEYPGDLNKFYLQGRVMVDFHTHPHIYGDWSPEISDQVIIFDPKYPSLPDLDHYSWTNNSFHLYATGVTFTSRPTLNPYSGQPVLNPLRGMRSGNVSEFRNSYLGWVEIEARHEGIVLHNKDEFNAYAIKKYPEFIQRLGVNLATFNFSQRDQINQYYRHYMSNAAVSPLSKVQSDNAGERLQGLAFVDERLKDILIISKETFLKKLKALGVRVEEYQGYAKSYGDLIIETLKSLPSLREDHHNDLIYFDRPVMLANVQSPIKFYDRIKIERTVREAVRDWVLFRNFYRFVERSYNDAVAKADGIPAMQQFASALGYPEYEARELLDIYNQTRRHEEDRLQVKDSAQNSKPDTGGIDLTKVKVDSRDAIKFHIDPAQLARLRSAAGLVPVIIAIRPLRSIRSFLGIPQAGLH